MAGILNVVRNLVRRRPEIVQIAQNCYEINGVVRVDRGPRMRTDVANRRTLDDDYTPSHYRAGARDAMANVIKPGKEFHWLDWRNRDSWLWYVYKLDDGRWVRVDFVDGPREDAIRRALEIMRQ